MKKRLISMLVCLALLAGLVAAHFMLSNDDAQGDGDEDVQNEQFNLISRDTKEIESIRLENSDFDLTFIPTNDDKDAWEIEGKESVLIYSSVINTLSFCFGEFDAYQKVETEDLNPTNFGFSTPTATATATYADGTSETLLIGTMTPDKQFSYIMRQGDNEIYLIYEYVARRFTRTMNDIINKDLPSIPVTEAGYFYVNQKDYQVVELAFDGTDEEMVELFESMGGIGLKMLQPFEGRDVYTTNLESNIAENLAGITISDLIELEPDDYGKYGLDEPGLELRVLNIYDAELHLYVGDRADDGFRYCRIGERSEVFTIASAYVDAYYNIDVFKFIARFTALINILEVDRVTVDSVASGNYVLNINHGVIPATEEGGTDTEVITPLINGVLVEETPFRKAYESIISIAYDSSIDPVQLTGEPAITITYFLNTGEPDIVVRLYDYNNDFYMVEGEDGVATFVTSKMSANRMFEKFDELLGN